MIQVFCLGPIEFDNDPDAFVAFSFEDEQMHEPIFALSVAECFAQLREQHPKDAIYCEPEHAKVGKQFGMKSRALSEGMTMARAGLAMTLASGDSIAPVAPPVLLELLVASTEFLAPEAWQRFDSEALLHAQIEGAIDATWEASVMGSGDYEYGVSLYCELGTHARMLATRDELEAQRVMSRASTVGITFDDEPEYAARAIGELTRIPFVPVPMHVEGGRLRPVDAEHLLVLAATLRAAASPDRAGTAGLDDLSVRVTLRDPAPVVVPVRATARRSRRR